MGGGGCGLLIVTGQAGSPQHDDVTRLFGHIRWNTGARKMAIAQPMPVASLLSSMLARTEQSCMHPEQAEQSGEAC